MRHWGSGDPKRFLIGALRYSLYGQSSWDDALKEYNKMLVGASEEVVLSVAADLRAALFILL